jgi:hypothetical protein
MKKTMKTRGSNDYSQIDQPQDIGKRIVSLCAKSDQYERGIAVDVWKPI